MIQQNMVQKTEAGERNDSFETSGRLGEDNGGFAIRFPTKTAQIEFL